MPLSDLTDPAAVNAAMDEFDRLGREGFLRKYGFGPSRAYFVRRDGKYYDSKAIVGAAHGLQYPQKGQLHSDDFSGGENTVRALLERLGFPLKCVDRTSTRSSLDLISNSFVKADPVTDIRTFPMRSRQRISMSTKRFVNSAR